MEFVTWARAQWDRLGALLATVGGVIALVVGYIGVSGTEYVALQLPYVLSGGMAGIFLLGVGAVLWLSADLRDEWREIRTVRTILQRQEANHSADSVAQLPHLLPGGPERASTSLRPSRDSVASHRQS